MNKAVSTAETGDSAGHQRMRRRGRRDTLPLHGEKRRRKIRCVCESETVSANDLCMLLSNCL